MPDSQRSSVCFQRECLAVQVSTTTIMYISYNPISKLKTSQNIFCFNVNKRNEMVDQNPVKTLPGACLLTWRRMYTF